MFVDIKNISQQDKDFLLLLNAGLWQKSGHKLSDNPDWEYIYHLAVQQAVVGIVSDGINILNQSNNLPQHICSKFIFDSANIVKCNDVLNRFQSKICQQLNTNNIRYVIIKGQAIAQSYPNPNLRSCGDIDILLPEDDYRKAKLILSPQATKVEKEISNSSHQALFFNDIVIELHSKALSDYKKRMDQVIDHECSRMFTQNDIDTYYSNEVEINIPNHTYHALFLFYHIIHHAIYSKIGLRQFCDWALFCSVHKDKIDQDHLSHLIKQAGIQSLWNRYANFCSQYLNCSSIPCNSKCTAKVDWLWHLCKYSGNMGRQRPAYHVRSRNGISTLKIRIYILKELVERYIIERRYSSQMALHNLFYVVSGYVSNAITNIVSKSKCLEQRVF